MKKVFLFVYLLSISITAQTLYTDDKGVEIFYTIEKAHKSTFCKGNATTDPNYSNKRIQVWKVTLGIKNGYTQTIIPRGIGIANISVIPNPIKPYSSNYCRYNPIKDYESEENSKQSLFSWQIRDFKVNEIQRGKVITNIAYLYLYDGQIPQLSNWQFRGYRLKEDFRPYDPIFIALQSSTNKTKVISEKPKEKKQILTVTSKAVKKPVQSVIKTSNITELNIDNKSVIDLQKKIKPSPVKVKKLQAIPEKCPGKKALAYKEKSNTAQDISAQKAYSWLALYYTYKCECENGSPRSDFLVAIINNVVDSYTENTNGNYEEISKVTKCKMPEDFKLTEN